jgi:prevent-host-death family protein
MKHWSTKKEPPRWSVQDAKARFSELLEVSVKDGPQVITKRGVETAVLVPIEEWRRLSPTPRRTLKELLLAEEPRFDFELPERGKGRWREPPSFD